MLPLGCMGSVVYLYLHGIPENSKPYRHPKSFQDFPCKRKPLKAFFRPRRCELGFMKKPILTERCLDVQGFKYQTGSVDVPHRSSQGVLNVQGCQTFKNLNLLLLTIFPSENWGGGQTSIVFGAFCWIWHRGLQMPIWRAAGGWMVALYQAWGPLSSKKLFDFNSSRRSPKMAMKPIGFLQRLGFW